MNKYVVWVDTVFTVEADSKEQAKEFVENNFIAADIDSENLLWDFKNVVVVMEKE